MTRLLVYGIGLALGCGVVAMADAWRWSGLRTFLVALGFGAFYTVTVLVPWLIWRQRQGV
jgi:hypothetical protein